MNFTSLASQETLQKTTTALKANNFEFVQVEDKAAALAKLQELIPADVSVMNGTSITLEQIGFVELLKSGNHPWNNLHAGIVAETDPAKQGKLRREAVLSDYYVGSAHAITENGEIVIASNSGSQLPHSAYTSPNVIFVVGAQKIVPTIADAFTRIDEHIVPLEHKHMQELYGVNTSHAKTLILHKENPAWGRKVTVVIVNESLGF